MHGCLLVKSSDNDSRKDIADQHLWVKIKDNNGDCDPINSGNYNECNQI